MHEDAPRAVDHDALLALVNHAALAGEAELEPKPRAAFVAELTSPQLDAARDLRVWRDAGGAIRAFARIQRASVRDETHGRLHYAIGDTADAALEPALIAWAAGRLCAAAPAPRRLVHAIAVRDPDRAARLGALGFAPYRRRLDMGRSLDAPIPDAPLPAGYRVRACRGAADAAGYVAAFAESFVDTLDFMPLTVAEFLHDVAGPAYRPEHDLILEAADGSIAGFCYVTLDDELPSLGYVGGLGVLRAHRRLGLGASLLAVGLRGLRGAGRRDVHLHVDVDSPTGATRLYARLGFTVRCAEVRHALDEQGLAALLAR